MGEILELGRSRLKVKITTLMLMDSLEMADGDRLKIKLLSPMAQTP